MLLQQHIHEANKKFHALFDSLFDTQWSEAALPEARSQLAVCEKQACHMQENIDLLSATVDKKYQSLLALKGHGVRHLWYQIRGKLKQRLDQQEIIWLRESEKCKEEEQRLSLLKQKIHIAQMYLHQCQNAYEKYTNTKQELEGLFERFFSGATPVYPDEFAIEQNLKKEKAHLVTLLNNHHILTRVISFLEKAHQVIVVAREAFGQALNMGTFDLCFDTSYADMAVKFYLAQARVASAEAQQCINEARRLNPDISNIDTLYIKQDNPAFIVSSGNISTDTDVRRRIRELLDCIVEADAVLVGILVEIKEQFDEHEDGCEKARENLKRLAAELFKTRVAIVRSIM